MDYIFSLGQSDAPDYGSLVEVVPVEDEIDLGSDVDALFQRAPEARFPLLGQITEPGRSFFANLSADF